MNQTATDLFDYATSVAAKKDGMDRVSKHADTQWSEKMLELVRVVCTRNRDFTSDQVFLLAAERGIATETHDSRAFGPVMIRASKTGYCRKANVAPRNSIRPSLHCSPRSVWESLIYEGGQ